MSQSLIIYNRSNDNLYLVVELVGDAIDIPPKKSAIVEGNVIGSMPMIIEYYNKQISVYVDDKCSVSISNEAAPNSPTED